MTITKRAQTGTDLVIVIVVIFFAAFVGVVFSNVYGRLNNGIQSSTFIDPVSKAANQQGSDGMAHGFDVGIVVGLSFLCIGLFFTAREIETHPMFLFLNIFVIIFSLGFGAIMSNVFNGTNTSDFAATRALMPGTIFLMNHLLEFGVVCAFLIIVGLFAKPSGAQ